MKNIFLKILVFILILQMTGVACFAEDVSVGELRENSWRYEDGKPINNGEISLFSTTAWSKQGDNFVNDKGNVITGATMKSIDVSYHQGTIDWESVKNTDVDFAIIRCGYGSNSTVNDDKMWVTNADACTSLGIPFGVYLYSYALTVEGAKSEAQHVLRLIEDYNLAYPVYYDLEDSTQSGLSASLLGDMAEAFCSIIQDAGYDVGIYANKYWWTSKLTDSAFSNSSWYKWVAEYSSVCSYTGSYTMWQATSSGKVNGISGNVDVNFWFGEGPSSKKLGRYIVTTSGSPLRLRSGAGTSFLELANIPNGTTVYVTQINGNWGYTTYEGIKGWISLDYAVFSPEITGLSVNTQPSKILYSVGDKIDTAGLSLTATYSDGTKKTVKSGFTTSYDFTSAGVKTVTVRYDGLSTSYSVTVADPSATLNLGKYVVTTSGAVLRIRAGAGTNFEQVGSVLNTTEIKVTMIVDNWGYITYDGVSGWVSLDYAVYYPEITKIAVKTKPDKLEYLVGDKIDTTGLVLKATYSDGTTKTVKSGFTTSYDFSTAGSKTVTVKYEGFKTTYKVTVTKEDDYVKKSISFSDINGNVFEKMPERGGFYVEMNFDKNIDEPTTPNIIFAAYNSEGKLLDVKNTQEEHPKGKDLKSKAYLEVADTETVAYVKVFVWDSFAGQSPLSNLFIEN